MGFKRRRGVLLPGTVQPYGQAIVDDGQVAQLGQVVTLEGLVTGIVWDRCLLTGSLRSSVEVKNLRVVPK